MIKGDDLMKPNIKENICINTEKVYDWIIGESTGSTSIPVGDLPVPLPADATNVKVDCILTDIDGIPIQINAELDIEETPPREDVQLDIEGTLITLQRITFTKSLFAVLEVSGVDPEDGSQFFITSEPVPFNFVETALLCAPVGTTLVVRISNFSSSAIINRGTDGEITGFGLQIFICQSIQSIAPVTVELATEFCAPRDALLEGCSNPTIPPQCPIIFPGNSNAAHKKIKD